MLRWPSRVACICVNISGQNSPTICVAFSERTFARFSEKIQQGLRQDLRVNLRPDLHYDLRHGLRHDLREDLLPELRRDFGHSLHHDIRRDLHQPEARHRPSVGAQLAPSSADEEGEADRWGRWVQESERAASRRVVHVAGVRASSSRSPSPDYFRSSAERSAIAPRAQQRLGGPPVQSEPKPELVRRMPVESIEAPVVRP